MRYLVTKPGGVLSRTQTLETKRGPSGRLPGAGSFLASTPLLHGGVIRQKRVESWTEEGMTGHRGAGNQEFSPRACYTDSKEE